MHRVFLLFFSDISYLLLLAGSFCDNMAVSFIIYIMFIYIICRNIKKIKNMKIKYIGKDIFFWSKNTSYWNQKTFI